MDEGERRYAQLERKLVCRSCRARKKRCGGERPTCSACQARNERCVYGPVSAVASSGGDAMTPHHHDTAQWPAIVGGSPWQTFNTSPFFPSGPAVSMEPAMVLSSPLESTPGSEYGQQHLPWTQAQLWSAMDWGDAAAAAPKMPTAGSNGVVGLNDPTLGVPYGINSTPQIDLEALSSPPSTQSAGTEQAPLPSKDQCVTLVDEYFRLIHPFLPLLHEATLRSSLAATCAQSVDTLGAPASPIRIRRGLLFAVLALASNERQDETSKDLRASWFEEAKRIYASTGHIPDSPLETLQLAVCVILQAYLSTDSSTSWLVLGKAWKQVVALGYHRLDRKQAARLPGAPALPEGWVERESIRRVVWMLYLLDRTNCLPVGLDFTVNEAQLGVSLPMGESAFQRGRIDTPPPSPKSTTQDPVTYNGDITRLVSAVRQQHKAQSQSNDSNPIHFVILAIMMLSRIVSTQAQLLEAGHADPSTADASITQLDNELSMLRMSLPRPLTSLSVAAQNQDFEHAVWMNILLCLNTIFLVYSSCETSNAGSAGVGSPAAELSPDQWARCVAAARSTVRILRQACHTSLDALLNPHVASAIFLCGRILVIEHLAPLLASSSNTTRTTPPVRTRESSLASLDEGAVGGAVGGAQGGLAADIDVIKLVFERLEELFYPLGRKFSNGIRFYQKQDVGFLSRIRNSRVGDLLAQCSSWADDT